MSTKLKPPISEARVRMVPFPRGCGRGVQAISATLPYRAELEGVTGVCIAARSYESLTSNCDSFSQECLPMILWIFSQPCSLGLGDCWTSLKSETCYSVQY